MFTIREATVDDVALILRFIRELADYERLADRVVATEERVRETLFGAKRYAEVIIGEERRSVILSRPFDSPSLRSGSLRAGCDGEGPRGEGTELTSGSFAALRPSGAPPAQDDKTPVGFALFFHNYSTFLARPGIYLEDLYVTPEARGRGYGKALLARLAQIAIERDCGRVEWAVLDWNAPSIAFYESLGAVPLDEWRVFRLTAEPLQRLAATGARASGPQSASLRLDDEK